MEFWICFYCLVLFFVIMALYDRKNSKLYLHLSVLTIWFIGAFRWNIGTDYYQYEIWYDTWEMYKDGSVNLGEIEPAFYLICTLLHFLNLNSQALFVVYESIIVLFLYKGLRFYVKYDTAILMALFLFVVYPTSGGHWSSMNIIRQAAAVSISFWATRYLCEKNYKKFLLGTALSISFHYSSIFVTLLILFCERNIHKVFLLLILLMGFLLNWFGITGSIVMQIIKYMAGFVGKYEEYVLNGMIGGESFSITAFMLVVIYFIVLKINSRPLTRKSFVIVNGAALYLVLRVYTSFGLEGSFIGTILHRFEIFFVFFYLIFIIKGLRAFISKQRNKIIANATVILFMLLWAGWGVYGLDKEMEDAKLNGDSYFDNPSKGNISYQFNFDIVDD